MRRYLSIEFIYLENKLYTFAVSNGTNEVRIRIY